MAIRMCKFHVFDEVFFSFLQLLLWYTMITESVISTGTITKEPNSFNIILHLSYNWVDLICLACIIFLASPWGPVWTVSAQLKEICLNWSSTITGLETNFLNLKNRSFENVSYDWHSFSYIQGWIWNTFCYGNSEATSIMV